MPQHTGFGRGDVRPDDPLAGYEPAFTRALPPRERPAHSGPEWTSSAEVTDSDAEDDDTSYDDEELTIYTARSPFRLGSGWWREHWRSAVALVLALVGGAAAFAFWPASGGGVLAGSRAMGTLVISAHPSPATVLLDGFIAGATPMAIDLPAGAHSVEVRGLGGAFRVFDVEIHPGRQAAQHVELATPEATPAPGLMTTGSLHVESEPAGAVVTLDGRSYGATPVTITDLEAGKHEVRLRSDSGSATREVDVTSGTTSNLFLSLAGSAQLPLAGWIVPPKGQSLEIYENDRLIGSSAQDRIMVTAGRHEVMLVNDALGFRAQQTLSVAAGSSTPIRVDWPRVGVNVNATPWAEVKIDGEPRGQTPLAELSLPIGAHQVEFSHPSFGVRTMEVVVRLGATNRFSVDLRK